jgi:hypothetical protein
MNGYQTLSLPVIGSGDTKGAWQLWLTMVAYGGSLAMAVFGRLRPEPMPGTPGRLETMPNEPFEDVKQLSVLMNGKL